MVEQWVHECPGKILIVRQEDALAISCLVEEPTNLILNGDFTAGQTGWMVRPSDMVSISLLGGVLSLTLLQTISVLQIVQKDIKLQPNVTYKLTFNAKISPARTMNVSIVQDASPYTNYGLDANPAIKAIWQSFSLTFLSSTLTQPDARIRFRVTNPVQGTVWSLDNIILQAQQ